MLEEELKSLWPHARLLGERLRAEHKRLVLIADTIRIVLATWLQP